MGATGAVFDTLPVRDYWLPCGAGLAGAGAGAGRGIADGLAGPVGFMAPGAGVICADGAVSFEAVWVGSFRTPSAMASTMTRNTAPATQPQVAL